MKKALKNLLAAAITLTTVLCGITNTALAQTQMTEESLMKNIKTPEGQTITLLEYKTLFNNYAKVAINERGLCLEDNPVDRVMVTLEMKYKFPDVEAYLLSLLASKTPQLKARAIMKLKKSPTTNTKIVNALKDETNLYVINSGIRALSGRMNDNADVAKFILSNKDNENYQIRLSVVGAVSYDKSYRDIPGVMDAIRTLMSSDPNNRVRSTIIEKLGNWKDTIFLADFIRILNDADQSYCHRSALESLFKLWYNPNLTCKQAYDATVNYLTKKPRTDNFVYPNMFFQRNYYTERYNEWKAKNDYFSESKWIEIMTDIATDNSLRTTGRSYAVKEVATLGTKENLEAIKAKVEANPVDDEYFQKDILKTIDEALAKK